MVVVVVVVEIVVVVVRVSRRRRHIEIVMNMLINFPLYKIFIITATRIRMIARSEMIYVLMIKARQLLLKT